MPLSAFPVCHQLGRIGGLSLTRQDTRSCSGTGTLLRAAPAVGPANRKAPNVTLGVAGLGNGPICTQVVSVRATSRGAPGHYLAPPQQCHLRGRLAFRRTRGPGCEHHYSCPPPTGMLLPLRTRDAVGTDAKPPVRISFRTDNVREGSTAMICNTRCRKAGLQYIEYPQFLPAEVMPQNGVIGHWNWIL